jgi:hypothetical protein
MPNNHEFDQEQIYGKPEILGPQHFEQQTHSNTRTIGRQHMVQQHREAHLQPHGGAGFRSTDEWGSSDSGNCPTLSSSLINHQPLMFEASLPTTTWSSPQTQLGVSSGGDNYLCRTPAIHFQQQPTPNILMALEESNKGPAHAKAEQVAMPLVSLTGGRTQKVSEGGLSGSGILNMSEREGGEQASSIATSQHGTNKMGGSSFDLSQLKTGSFAGIFEPAWWAGSDRPEESPGQPNLSLAGMTTSPPYLQENSFSSHQNKATTAPLMLDAGASSLTASSLGQFKFLENLQSIYAASPSAFPDGSPLTALDMHGNEANAINLMHHFQMMHQKARIQEQGAVPMGVMFKTTPGNAPEAVQNSEVTHIPEEQNKLMDTKANFLGKEDSADNDCKISSSTLQSSRATGSTGIGAWSAASAELLDDLETLTREKTSRFKKKSTNKPKRPLSAYNIFFKEERERILREIPDDTATATTSAPAPSSHNSRMRRGKRVPHGKIDFQNLAKAVGKRWQNLSPEAMAVYKEKANDDLVRYKREMEEFMKTMRSFEE